MAPKPAVPPPWKCCHSATNSLPVIMTETPTTAPTNIVIQFDYGKDEDDKSLADIPVDKRNLKTFYNHYPPETLEAFNKITKFAREYVRSL